MNIQQIKNDRLSIEQQIYEFVLNYNIGSEDCYIETLLLEKYLTSKNVSVMLNSTITVFINRNLFPIEYFQKEIFFLTYNGIRIVFSSTILTMNSDLTDITIPRDYLVRDVIENISTWI